MDTLPLPPRPNLEQYKRRAKDLVSAAASKDRDAIRAWATRWLDALTKSLGITITPFVQGSFDRAVSHLEESVRAKLERDGGFNLADAQFLVAGAHGFASWADFANHVQPDANQPADAFETAADAVVSGDLETLRSLVRANPGLPRAHSRRVHHATLLHYVAANGVEDFRQKTPPNAVEIATFLLESGSEVDALADTYGKDKYQTTMNLLVSSTHPAEAGVQSRLVETLADFGAAVDGLDGDSSPLMTALAFGYRDAAETLVTRGAKLDSVLAAAALGRADLVARYVVDPRTLRPGVPFVGPAWFGLPNDAAVHIELAFVWACKFGREEVAQLLLDKGLDPASRDTDQMTALHWASASGMTGVMRRLLAAGAPLEVENVWGGTVLDSTTWFVVNMPARGANYEEVIEILIAAGADVRAVTPFPTGDARVDAILTKHGRA